MARRSKQPSGRSIDEDVRPMVDRFVAKLARMVDRRIARDLRRRVSEELRSRKLWEGTRGAPLTCYFPGCENVAAPRFGMFCAAEHKDLAAGKKAKYRALHKARRGTAG